MLEMGWICKTLCHNMCYLMCFIVVYDVIIIIIKMWYCDNIIIKRVVLTFSSDWMSHI